jgi:transcriptional regulator with XRE-family HTH domain
MKDENMDHIEKLKFLRKTVGSVERLAFVLNISASAIWKWIYGINKPSRLSIDRIERVYKKYVDTGKFDAPKLD